NIDKSQIESRLPVKNPVKRESGIQQVEKLSIREKKERYFLKAMINDRSLFEYCRDQIDAEVLTSQLYYGIFKGLCNYIDSHDTFAITSLIKQKPNELLEVVININNFKIKSHASLNEIDDYLDDLSSKTNSNKEKKILFAQLAEAAAANDA